MTERDSFTVIAPFPSFEELSSIKKGDLGEKFIEYCLKSLLLKENKDFRTYPRTLSFEKEKVPDFSDDVKGKRKTFEIEAKNLASTTEVSPGWIKKEVLTRFSKDVQNKVLVIFGGDIYSRVPELLKDENVFYIRHISPVSAKDYFDLLWWLKDKLLEVPNIRKRAIVAISRIWEGKIERQFSPITLAYRGNDFLLLWKSPDSKRFELRTFPDNRVWEEEWENIYSFLEEDRPSWIDWKK